MKQNAVQPKPSLSRSGLFKWMAALLLPTTLAACPSVKPIPALEVDPATKAVSAGSPAVTFKANVRDSLETVQWVLIGPGSISATSGPSVEYTPPTANTVSAAVTATLTASLPTTGLNKAASITVNPTLGSMQVSVGGLPNGTNASVTVSGPGGFSQALTASQVLTGLTPGSYSLTANNVVVGAVTFGGTVTGSPATVSAGVTAQASVSYAALTEALTVNVSGLPGGVNGDVLITGPDGFTQTITASQTLTGLNLGNYTITPRSVQQQNAVVNTVFDGASSTATLTANATATANATYAPRGGSGAMWIANQGGSLARYGAGQLIASGSPAPDGLLNPGAGVGPQGMAFDKGGNLWVIDNANNKLLKFSSAKLGGTGAITPDVIISDNNGALNEVYAMAFAPDGSLVVSNVAASTSTRNLTSTLVRYAPKQIAQSGNPAPALILDIQFNRPEGARGIAFDAQGDLWVGTTGDLLRYSAAQIAQTGNVVFDAATRVRSPQGGASGLAFDASGNLWVSFDASGGKPTLIAKYTPAQLAAGTPGPTPPVPNVSLSGLNVGTGTLLAFDNAGNLWFTGGFGSATVSRLNASQLTSNASPTPAVIISGASLNAPFGIAFSATPANLPLVK
jgi:sugar lactone lactonase YvrE